MLEIRPEQMEALTLAQHERFVQAMTASLRRSFGARLDAMSRAELRARIDAGIDAAARCGIEDAADVEGFLWFVVAYGPDFGRTPETAWARTALRDRSMSGSEKITALETAWLFEGGGMNDA